MGMLNELMIQIEQSLLRKNTKNVNFEDAQTTELTFKDNWNLRQILLWHFWLFSQASNLTTAQASGFFFLTEKKEIGGTKSTCLFGPILKRLWSLVSSYCLLESQKLPKC